MACYTYPSVRALGTEFKILSLLTKDGLKIDKACSNYYHLSCDRSKRQEQETGARDKGIPSLTSLKWFKRSLERLTGIIAFVMRRVSNSSAALILLLSLKNDGVFILHLETI